VGGRKIPAVPGASARANEAFINEPASTDAVSPPAPVVKTAVIGASGFVGRQVCQAYRQVYADAVGTAFSNAQNGLTHFDLRQPDLAALRLEESGHRAVLIASAKPNIDFCEREKEAAHAVNVSGTLSLIRQIAKSSMQVIFLSSDYVFDGRAGQYDDDAPTNPTTEYGRQKALVEHELPALTDNYLILRLSKMFGLEKGDRTLLDDLASSLAAGRRVRVARDQIFCPTYIGDLVTAIQAIQDLGLTGTLNLCNPASWSRLGVAQALAETMGADSSLVEPVNLHDVPAMAGRPLNTSMQISRFRREVGGSFQPLASSIHQAARNWMPDTAASS
jgi:dTDP-4-dehydrorhamnose reductase